MREILFRGKDWDGEWQKGSLMVFEDGCCAIWHPIKYGNLARRNVNPETVGQYTGLQDKNGTKIFEGDVMRFVSPDLEEPSAIRYIVEYIEDGFALRVPGRNLMEEFDGVPELYEIIGNIHDNPELVSKKEDENA